MCSFFLLGSFTAFKLTVFDKSVLKYHKRCLSYCVSKYVELWMTSLYYRNLIALWRRVCTCVCISVHVCVQKRDTWHQMYALPTPTPSSHSLPPLAS